jgi:hypothetical protein
MASRRFTAGFAARCTPLSAALRSPFSAVLSASLLATSTLPAAAVPAPAVPTASAAATLYSGGDILTMAGPSPEYAEALVERNGKIVYVGPLAGAIRAAGGGARRVNLAGRTLLPGFIDTHGHFIYFGKNLIDADLYGASSI